MAYQANQDRRKERVSERYTLVLQLADEQLEAASGELQQESLSLLMAAEREGLNVDVDSLAWEVMLNPTASVGGIRAALQNVDAKESLPTGFLKNPEVVPEAFRKLANQPTLLEQTSEPYRDLVLRVVRNPPSSQMTLYDGWHLQAGIRTILTLSSRIERWKEATRLELRRSQGTVDDVVAKDSIIVLTGESAE